MHPAVKPVMKGLLGYILMIGSIMLIGMLFSCASPKAVYQAKWDKFNQCIESYPSDYMCDSCYNVIFHK